MSRWGNARRRGLFGEHVAIDTSTIELSAQAFGQHPAATEGSPGNCDYGHNLASFPMDRPIGIAPQNPHWRSARAWCTQDSQAPQKSLPIKLATAVQLGYFLNGTCTVEHDTKKNAQVAFRSEAPVQQRN